MSFLNDPFVWGCISGLLMLLTGSDLTSALIAHWGISIYFTLKQQEKNRLLGNKEVETK